MIKAGQCQSVQSVQREGKRENTNKKVQFPAPRTYGGRDGGGLAEVNFASVKSRSEA